jgi:hypothetical protein
LPVRGTKFCAGLRGPTERVLRTHVSPHTARLKLISVIINQIANLIHDSTHVMISTDLMCHDGAADRLTVTARTRAGRRDLVSADAGARRAPESGVPMTQQRTRTPSDDRTRSAKHVPTLRCTKTRGKCRCGGLNPSRHARSSLARFGTLPRRPGRARRVLESSKAPHRYPGTALHVWIGRIEALAMHPASRPSI